MSGGWVMLTIAAAVAGLLFGRWLGTRSRRSPGAARQAAVGHEQVIEISRLAGGLAHEIRNPLSTLKVNLQLLGEDWSDESIPEQELRRRSLTRLAAVQTEATRLHHIVDDFLRLVGGQELRLVTQDVNELVRQFVDFYGPQAQANGVRIEMLLSDRPLTCRIDADLCKQALLNLCINAQEAMPQGGTLTLRTSPAGPLPAAGAERGWPPPSPSACIEVADTGPGLDAEALGRIFEPYYSTKPGGTGLGLAITRRIVHAHHGTISVRSRPGEGTTFTITLPLAER